MNLIPYSDPDFEKACEEIAVNQIFTPYINEIAMSIATREFTKERINQILQKHRIGNIQSIKHDTMDLLLASINFILDDGVITEKELANLKVMKRVFKIKEGDSYSMRLEAVQKILNKQFQKIYKDNVIDKNEAILKVGLQELFDLGYDQFQELSRDEVKAALERGADLNDLDAVLEIKDIQNIN